MRWTWLWWMLGVLWLAWITYASIMPSPPGASLLNDKLQHLLVYASLGYWFGCLVQRVGHRRLVVALALWGGMLELLQGLGGMRHAEWLDAFCNACGALLGVVVARTPCGSMLHHLERRLRWLA